MTAAHIGTTDMTTPVKMTLDDFTTIAMNRMAYGYRPYRHDMVETRAILAMLDWMDRDAPKRVVEPDEDPAGPRRMTYREHKDHYR